MKNSIMKALLLGAVGAAGLLCACDDAEYDTFGARAFISESTSSSSRSEKVTITDDGADVEVTACLSSAVSQDVTLRFEIDESILDTYNKAQASSFVPLPASNFEMEAEVTIPAGSYSASATRIHILPLSAEQIGESYAIPLRLVSVSGGVPVTSTTSTYIITTETVTTSSLPMFIGNAGLTSGEVSLSLPQYTIECRFQVSNTDNRNRAVFTNGGSVLLRFEDPQNDTDGVPAHSYVQFQGEGWYHNPSDYFRTNKWQHLALTYDGKAITLYVNGAKAGTKEGVCDPTFAILAWFGGDAGGGHGTGDPAWWAGCKILCSELRVWSVCRTEAQIQNNMTTTGSSSEGLVGYWRMSSTWAGTTTENGKTLYTFEDCTGHGYTLKTEVAPIWVDGIKSTDTETAWPE